MSVSISANINIEKTILALWGFLGTMPILQFKGVTFFTLMILLAAVYNLIHSPEIDYNPGCRYYAIICILAVFSVITCYVSNIPNFWKAAQPLNLIWELLYFFIFLVYNNVKKQNLIQYYIKGVYIAAIVQMFWGFLQLAFYYAKGILLNDVVFVNLLKMVEQASQVKDGEITLSGMCWNAGNIAPLIIFGYAFTKNVYLKILFGVFSIVSGSRTLMVGFAVCFGVELLRVIIRAVDRIRSTKVGKGMLIFILALAGIIVFLNNDAIINKISAIIKSFTTMQTQSSARLHMRYWTSVPHVTAGNTLLRNLFGYGLGSSGYSQVIFYGQYADSAYPWVLECDFINQLWNRGYIGFIVLYYWLFKSYIKGMKIDYRYAIFFAGLLVEGILYNVMFNWCWILILFMIILINRGQKVEV